jgi:hypothetical protein
MEYVKFMGANFAVVDAYSSGVFELVLRITLLY